MTKIDTLNRTLTPFTITPNEYLNQEVAGFYREVWDKNSPTHPDYMLKIKNDPHHTWSQKQIKTALEQLFTVLYEDIINLTEQILAASITNQLYISVIPRAKKESYYRDDQLLFKYAVKALIDHMANSLHLSVMDGTHFIMRHTDTKTTHLKKPDSRYINKGSLPYPGITEATCTLTSEIEGKTILVLDDIYTKTVNVVEDALQALINHGARQVVFYSVAYTRYRGLNK